MNGSFYEHTKIINNDKDLFEIIVKFFPDFKDERIYNGKKIYFYKLAQLLTSDVLHIKSFKDRRSVECSHLIGCVDYIFMQKGNKKLTNKPYHLTRTINY